MGTSLEVKWKCHLLSRIRLFCSLPGSSVHGILQARILEWVAFSRGSSQLRDWTQASCIAGRFFTVWAIREAQISLTFNNFKQKSLRNLYTGLDSKIAPNSEVFMRLRKDSKKIPPFLMRKMKGGNMLVWETGGNPSFLPSLLFWYPNNSTAVAAKRCSWWLGKYLELWEKWALFHDPKNYNPKNVRQILIVFWISLLITWPGYRYSLRNWTMEWN